MFSNSWSCLARCVRGIGLATSFFVLALLGRVALGDLPQTGDVILGANQFVTPANTFELLRGPANGSGSLTPSPWVPDASAQSVQFDNFNGIPHNARGNLLGVDFGGTTTGYGKIYSYSTTNAGVTVGQLIGDTLGMGGSGLTPARLSALSVSPDNSKIAVGGNDPGTVIVYDYTPGDTMGGGASLSNARQTGFINTPSVTQGTTWLDNDTVLSLNSNGTLSEVDAASMSASTATTVNGFIDGSRVTALEYSPSVSPYLYAAISQFANSVTTNRLFVLDPRVGYSLVNEIDLSTSANTLRDLALDPDGNLFISQFNAGGTGPIIDVILDVVTNPATIADNSSSDWYTTTLSASFNGIDVALGGSTPVVDADFNDDGMLDCLDVNGLTVEIAGGTNNPSFDLTGDGNVNGDDLGQWLSDAGDANIGPGRPYRYGDANLDGVVDGSDFGTWNANKFSPVAEWCRGDFNADGFVDGSDFGTWNSNKFTASDAGSQVPEPAAFVLAIAVACAGLRRRC